MSKTKPYPAVTKDFGSSFGESPSKQPKPARTYSKSDFFPDEPKKEDKPVMSNVSEKLQRTEILELALANATAKPTRHTHLRLLDEHEWNLVHQARKNGSKAGLQQLFISMQRNYQDNDEAFFANYQQFYNAYRQAVKVYSLAPIKPRKPKEEAV